MFPLLAILALLAYFLLVALTPLLPQIATAATAPNKHALMQHNVKAISAGECFSGGGTIQARRINPNTHRSITACLAPNGTWFIHVQEKNGQTVTMFAKEKLRTLKQILQYMKNSGYIDLP
jgi:hypothetical protein